jgi:hypothetical protein
LVRDVQTFIDHIGERHGFAPEATAIIAQSVGAVVVAAWVHDYAPRIRGMVLASPAFRVKLYVPLALPGLRLMRALRGNFFVKSYVKAKLLTRDPERAASYDSDPLIARSISVNILLGLQQTSDRVVEDAAAITAPTQLLMSDRDWVVHDGPQHAFFDRLGATTKEKHVLQGFYHDTLGERDRAVALAHARRFLLGVFDRAPATPDLTASDRQGFTNDEAEALRRPLSRNSPSDLYWRATRATLRVGAMLSDGLRVGNSMGFDSGSMLDYVYRNVASGRTPVGRLIDRVYLDSVGWRGIRQRSFSSKSAARSDVAVACTTTARAYRRHRRGRGRYVLDAIAEGMPRPDSIVLRDYGEANVRDGAALIRNEDSPASRTSSRADAFDARSLRRRNRTHDRRSSRDSTSFSPTTRWSANRSPASAARSSPAVPDLHVPAVASAARADRARVAQPSQRQRWVMRRRTQAEMDQWSSAPDSARSPSVSTKRDFHRVVAERDAR